MKKLYLAVAGVAVLASLPVQAATCFMSSKTYQIHPLHGGPDSKDSWTVKGDAFNQCVHRAEAADRSLRAHYPDTVYALSLAATVGCHSPCEK